MIAARRALVAAMALLASATCALPGRNYTVSPALHGRVRGVVGDEAGPGRARVEIVVRSRASPALGARETRELDDEGSFAFDPITLQVAGLEYDKLYQTHLYFRDANADAEREAPVIWRAQWQRGDIAEPIVLDCDLTRPPEHGQRCRVESADRHRWLVRQGKSEYEQSCAVCHGVQAVGGGPAASALATPLPDLTHIAARRGGEFDRTAIIASIDGRTRPVAHEANDMPLWGRRLTRQLEPFANAEDMAAARIDAIASYLESIQRPAHRAPSVRQP